MPRRKLIRQNDFPYHVITRTNNRTWFEIPVSEVWDICKEALLYALKKVDVTLHSYVLMSNHYHMLITTPESNIDRFMMFFNLRLSQLISKKSGVVNQKFSNRYKWSIVEDHNYLMNVYRYIYQNPVRANITKDCYSYPYSSLHFSKLEVKLFNYRPHINYHEEKSWFEERFGSDFEDTIRQGLNRERFKPSNSSSSFHLSILNRSFK
mgnify:CR=1 FL=1